MKPELDGYDVARKNNVEIMPIGLDNKKHRNNQNPIEQLKEEKCLENPWFLPFPHVRP